MVAERGPLSPWPMIQGAALPADEGGRLMADALYSCGCGEASLALPGTSSFICGRGFAVVAGGLITVSGDANVLAGVSGVAELTIATSFFDSRGEFSN